MKNGKHLRLALGLLGVVTLAYGAWLGLYKAPPEREMGDVYRIIYVHVPAVWMALLCVTINLVACVSYLLKASWKTDALAEASAEVGLMFGAFGIVLGAIWGRPTWGTYWTWDPRLTSAAVMLVAYTGYLGLRKFVEDPEKRAVWSAVVGIIAYVDIPIIWFSVKWWRSLHQVQSSPRTVDDPMTFALRVNAFAFLFLMLFFLWHRYRIARAERAAEVALPEALPSSTHAAQGALQ
jgi:heme exporter protein C